MKFFEWVNTWHRKPQPPAKKHLTCACCHERIRKGDKYKMLIVQHNDDYALDTEIELGHTSFR